jgi:hypothetical protein
MPASLALAEAGSLKFTFPWRGWLARMRQALRDFGRLRLTQPSRPRWGLGCRAVRDPWAGA